MGAAEADIKDVAAAGSGGNDGSGSNSNTGSGGGGGGGSSCIGNNLAAVGAATGGATGGRTAPRSRATSTPRTPCAIILDTRTLRAHQRSEAVMLMMDLPLSEQDLAAEAQAFKTTETGNCSVMVPDEVGRGELDRSCRITDSAATCNATPGVNSLANYRAQSTTRDREQAHVYRRAR